MKTKKTAAILTALILALVLTTGMIGIAAEEADAGEQTAETGEKTELEQFIADWGESYEGSLGQKDYTLDFNSYELGTDFSTLEDLMDLWTVGNATGDHITAIDGTDENKYLKFAPFSQMYLAEGITDKYVFSADIKIPANQGFGIFFRTSGETNINPYFEDDQSGMNIMGLGPNGIYLIPNEKSVKIYVKYYDERKSADKGMKYLNNKTITLKTEEDFGRRFVNIAVADYGTGAKVFINGKLLATIDFAEIVSGYDELLSEDKFYSLVTVYDSTGKQKAEVKNALVSADQSVLALGMRINEAYADNIVISEYQEAVKDISIDGTPKTDYTIGEAFDAAGATIVTTYESGKTKKTAITGSMLEGFDTATAGEKTVKIVFGDKEFELKINVSEPVQETEAPTQAPVEPTKGPDAPKEDETEKKNNTPLIVGLIAGGVLIAAIAVVAILLKMKGAKGK